MKELKTALQLRTVEMTGLSQVIRNIESNQQKQDMYKSTLMIDKECTYQ